MITLALLGLTRNIALVIAITVLVTALVCLGIFLIWSHLANDGEDGEYIGIDRRRVVTPTFVLLIISIMMNGIGLLGISVVTSDTNRVVGYVRDQTSPEARRAQNELLDGVLVKVDCNAASRLQRGFDALAEQGLIQPVDVTLGCGHKQATTTTTSP